MGQLNKDNILYVHMNIKVSGYHAKLALRMLLGDNILPGNFCIFTLLHHMKI